ncbi:hypothetical protein BKA70DRAFT_1258866 [Coprinopsis sp. MPI-PUGE-AT-0042]|nr:hypothetical protein BKA70DRAFT_1258866 [Coprinopsis sp. MPI-PUGE-AT-0042]
MEPRINASIEESVTLARENITKLADLRFVSGVADLEHGKAGLAFRVDDTKAGWLDFARPDGVSNSDLEALVRACAPATFGLGDKDVLDEQYRKAWKLDASKFATQLDVVRSGVVSVVTDALLTYKAKATDLEAHLDKMNVYGPGSFFKSHVDTPRDGSMVATLVIVLPTEHKGGDLLLLGEKPWTFESSKLVSNSESGGIPRLAFVGFYSDVEHEVTPVESGYRVTVTYNLYASQRGTSIPPQLHLATPEEKLLRDSLHALLSQPAVLPKGGFLGFGLTYKYPIAYEGRNLDCFEGILKGRDALIERTCDGLGLPVSVQAKYHAKYYNHRQDKETNNHYLLPTTKTGSISNSGDYTDHDHMWEKEHFSRNGVKIHGFKAGAEARRQVIWVTQPNDLMKAASPYLAYGNESSLAWKYGYLVLVAAVPPFEDRNMDGKDSPV